MNKQLHARKRRQFKSLSKQLNRLLQGEQAQVSKQKIEALALKIKYLLRELSGIIARWEMKKALGVAAVIFGLTTSSVQGQYFAEPVASPFGLSSNTALFAPILVDIDADGDLDLLVNEYNYDYSEQLTYYENIGTVSEPLFGEGQASPFGLVIPANYYASIVYSGAADLDNDGDVDILSTIYDYDYSTGSTATTFFYFENVGTASTPMFTQQNTPPGIDALSELGPVFPVFGDLDADGDFDLIAGIENEGYAEPLHYLENVGTASEPEFATPQANALGLTFSSSTLVYFSLSAMADLDLDGDTDLLCFVDGTYDNNGNEYGDGMFYFENTGTSTNPQFVVSERNPLNINIPVFGNREVMIPALGDLDNDGDIDMLGTAFENGFFYYENVLGVNTATPQADFPVNISPNPTNDYLNINTDESLSEIQIYDLTGRQIAAYDGRQTQISIQDLSSGTYIIRLINQEGEYLSKRIEKL